MLRSELLEQEWLNHIDSTFPRRVGFPRQRTAFNAYNYLYMIWRHLLLSPVHVALYSERQLEENLYDKIYFDLDDDTEIETAYIDMQDLRQYCVDKWGREPRIYFSGSKGFHVYIDFFPYSIHLPKFKETINLLVRDIEEATNITTIDHHCIDRKRIARLPFTQHMKSKKWCIPINYRWSLKKIFREATILDHAFHVECDPIGGDHRILDTFIEIKGRPEKEKQILQERDIKLDSHTLNDEIAILLELAPFVLDGRHRMLHFMIVPRLLRMGYNRVEILDFCETWIIKTGRHFQRYIDYVERSIIRSGNWIPWKFSTFFYKYPKLLQPYNTVMEKRKHDRKSKKG